MNWSGFLLLSIVLSNNKYIVITFYYCKYNNKNKIINHIIALKYHKSGSNTNKTKKANNTH